MRTWLRVGLTIALGALALLSSGCALFDLLRPVPVTPPEAPPSQVTATQGELEQAVRISWEQVKGAEFYRVFRAMAEEGKYELIGSTDLTSFLDQASESRPLAMGTVYWYRVRACNAAGCSELSEPVSGYAGYPPAPTGVQASDGAYPDKIVVSWDPVPGATGYQVYRDTAENGTYNTFVGETASASVEDTRVSAGIRYWYRVRACNGWGCSPLSPARDSGCVAPCPVP